MLVVEPGSAMRVGGWEKKFPHFSSSQNSTHLHSAQGLRYCRAKALPNQPYMTHNNTFNLIENLWISKFLMDVGVSRTKVDAHTYPLKQGGCVSSQL